MPRIALITGVNIETAEKRKKLLQNEGYSINFYGDPLTFLRKHGRKPTPELIVTAVHFKTTGLKGWENIACLLIPETLENTPILPYSVFIYDTTEVPLICKEAMFDWGGGRIFRPVFMNKWAGKNLNPRCFDDIVLPRIKKVLPVRAEHRCRRTIAECCQL